MLAILYALIPLASFYGYKYGGAPKKSYVPILISMISLLIVVIMMVWLYGSIAATEGFTFSEAMDLQEFSASFFSDLLTSVLFLAIGVFFVETNV
jgi:prepilin signal peptidase PulO-like enzyme (type II secretory pathway)